MVKSNFGSRQHVFISHHHADDAGVDKMTKLLKSKNYDIRNSSIRAKPANQERLEKGRVSDAVIQRLLRSKISWAGCAVVLIGKDTHSRPWVNWEIEEAHRQGKRIVGVCDPDARDSEIPSSLDKYADAIVGWQADRIVDAISGVIDNWEKHDGTPFPKRTIPRVICQK